MRYKLLTNTDPLELGRLITNHLTKGWALYGLPLSTECGQHRPEIEYAQAIIAEKEKK